MELVPLGPGFGVEVRGVSMWNVDGGGNFAWQNATAFSSGSSLFQAIEASIQQDINGGGVTAGTTIESTGSVILRNVAGYLMLDAAGAVAGPLLSYFDNNYVTASQFEPGGMHFIEGLQCGMSVKTVAPR